MINPSSAPAFLRLPNRYDETLLVRDLENILKRFHPLAQRGSEEVLADALGVQMDVPKKIRAMQQSWRGLSLWSQGGEWERTDCGCPGLQDFSPTEALTAVPYMRHVLDDMGLAYRSVRLLSLAVGANILPHTDSDQSFRQGIIRLAIPIVTHKNVEYVIAGERANMAPGELWYTDVSQSHRLSNPGPIVRYQMVMDVEIDDVLISLFPAAFIEAQRAAGLCRRPKLVALTGSELEGYRLRFEAPPRFIPVVAHATVGSFAPFGTRLALCLDGKPVIALNPIGEHRFVMVGGVPALHLVIDPEQAVFRMVYYGTVHFEARLSAYRPV